MHIFPLLPTLQIGILRLSSLSNDYKGRDSDMKNPEFKVLEKIRKLIKKYDQISTMRIIMRLSIVAYACNSSSQEPEIEGQQNLALKHILTKKGLNQINY
jgi:hypothetical protein